MVARDEKIAFAPTLPKTGPRWLWIDYLIIVISLFLNIVKGKGESTFTPITNPDRTYLTGLGPNHQT
jgi:hypothetical protein